MESKKRGGKQSSINKKSAKNLLEAFNLFSSVAWLNLSTMEKNFAYNITDIHKHVTKFGDRLMVELDKTHKLYLPERYNALNDKQIAELSTGNYVLINQGAKGKCFQLQLILKSDIPVNTAAARASATSPTPSASNTATTDDEEEAKLKQYSQRPDLLYSQKHLMGGLESLLFD